MSKQVWSTSGGPCERLTHMLTFFVFVFQEQLETSSGCPDQTSGREVWRYLQGWVRAFFFFLSTRPLSLLKSTPFVPPTILEMDCLGHVKIEEDPDYAKWGIGIELSFRANERMSHLTAHVQSGGVNPFPCPYLAFNSILTSGIDYEWNIGTILGDGDVFDVSDWACQNTILCSWWQVSFVPHLLNCTFSTRFDWLSAFISQRSIKVWIWESNDWCITGWWSLPVGKLLHNTSWSPRSYCWTSIIIHWCEYCVSTTWVLVAGHFCRIYVPAVIWFTHIFCIGSLAPKWFQDRKLFSSSQDQGRGQTKGHSTMKLFFLWYYEDRVISERSSWSHLFRFLS